MPFESSLDQADDTPDIAIAKARHQAAVIKQRGRDLRTSSAAGPVSAMTILNYSPALADALDQFARTILVPGVTELWRTLRNDPARDIIAELNAISASAQICLDWIVGNFPKDASGFLLIHQLPANGRYTVRTIPTANTVMVGLRSRIADLEALIKG